MFLDGGRKTKSCKTGLWGKISVWMNQKCFIQFLWFTADRRLQYEGEWLLCSTLQCMSFDPLCSLLSDKFLKLWLNDVRFFFNDNWGPLIWNHSIFKLSLVPFAETVKYSRSCTACTEEAGMLPRTLDQKFNTQSVPCRHQRTKEKIAQFCFTAKTRGWGQTGASLDPELRQSQRQTVLFLEISREFTKIKIKIKQQFKEIKFHAGFNSQQILLF